MPYLDNAEFYQQIRLDEPWNSRHNLTLFQSSTFKIWRCPAAFKNDPQETNYIVITGPGTSWPKEGCLKKTDIIDGLDETILVVEVAESNIPWYEPRDLPIESFDPIINHDPRTSISSHHPRSLGPHVLFIDGHTQRLKPSVNAETIRALITPNGGEKIDIESLQTHSFWK